MTSATPWVLLITKNDYAHASDGGSKRVNAVAREIQDAGFVVEPVSGVADQRRHLPSAGRVREGLAFLRVLAVYLRIGSLSSLKWLRYSAVRQIVRSLADHGSAPSATVIEFTQMAPYRCAVGGPAMVDMHNVESGLLQNYADTARSRPRRVAARLETNRMRALERWVARIASSVVFVSESDRRHLETAWRLAGMPLPETAVAPNGIDDEFFEYEGERDGTVVFIGHLWWQPNIDAAGWLAREVWPRVLESEPSCHLLLVGRRPARAVQELATTSIGVCANVPSVAPYFGKASVSVAPLLAAGGTRIKILESLGAGTPVVATPRGALGLQSLAGTHLQLESGATGFAAAIVDFVRRPPRSREDIRARVSGYGWRATLKPLATQLVRLVAVRDR